MRMGLVQVLKPGTSGTDRARAMHRRCGSVGDIETVNIDVDMNECKKNEDKKRKADSSPICLRKDLANKNVYKEIKQMTQDLNS